MPIYMMCELFHKKISREQCDSRQPGQTLVPLALRLHFCPLCPGLYRRGQGPSSGVQSWLLKRCSSRMKHAGIQRRITTNVHRCRPRRLSNPRKVNVSMHRVGKATPAGSHPGKARGGPGGTPVSSPWSTSTILNVCPTWKTFCLQVN